MKYVLLIHESAITSRQIAKSFNEEWDVNFNSEGIDFHPTKLLSDPCYHVWLRYGEDCDTDCYEEEEKAIFSDLHFPKVGLVNYRDDKALKKVLETIALNINCYIDNDYGTILQGNEFMKKWSRDWSDDNATLNWCNEYFK